ncbi:MAG: polyprenyl synthetase family protein [bacterium]|nr:polyprenyl synthetase family protein [bacterium]
MNFETRYRQTVEEIFCKDVPGFVIARDFCLGEGKHIRSHLLLDAVHAWMPSGNAESSEQKDAVQSAIAVELLHHYLLIHDDLMDRDVLRRGKLTVYASCHETYGREKGEGIAIAVGDYLINEALALLCDVDPKALSIAISVLRETIKGQLLEYVADTTWSLEQIETFYQEKTALYTFALPLRIAELISKKEVSTEIELASNHLGIAYQFRDDLNEYVGLKKRDAEGGRDDFSRGKMTVVNRLFLDRLDSQSRLDLERAWKVGMSAEEIARWKSKADELGVVSEIEKMILIHVEYARETIRKLGLEKTESIKDVFAYIK